MLLVSTAVKWCEDIQFGRRASLPHMFDYVLMLLNVNSDIQYTCQFKLFVNGASWLRPVKFSCKINYDLAKMTLRKGSK